MSRVPKGLRNWRRDWLRRFALDRQLPREVAREDEERDLSAGGYMYVIIDHRPNVTEAYASSLASEGVASLGLQPREFREWFDAASEADVEGVQSIVVGECEERATLSDFIRRRTLVPIIALSEVRNLATTLDLFSAGVDDVIRTPVHVREIIARSNAIWRRINRSSGHVTSDRLKIYFDGRDVEIDGLPVVLPRRERRILEFLVRNAHRRVSKTQIFNAVYGPFEDLVDEVVIEGHVSKLRKKLRLRLGYDVIDAKRYLGYQFVADRREVGNSSGASSPVTAPPRRATGDWVRGAADFADATLAPRDAERILPEVARQRA